MHMRGSLVTIEICPFRGAIHIHLPGVGNVSNRIEIWNRIEIYHKFLEHSKHSKPLICFKTCYLNVFHMITDAKIYCVFFSFEFYLVQLRRTFVFLWSWIRRDTTTKMACCRNCFCFQCCSREGETRTPEELVRIIDIKSTMSCF